jgi:hypothetical protein
MRTGNHTPRQWSRCGRSKGYCSFELATLVRRDLSGIDLADILLTYLVYCGILRDPTRSNGLSANVCFARSERRS